MQEWLTERRPHYTMKDEVHIIPLADRERWEAEHRVDGLPSQAWSYAWALSASGVQPQLAVVHAGGARMVMPFFERDWLGTTDVATTLGLSGASIAPNSTAPLSLWQEFATAQGWVDGYIQLATSVDLAPGSVPGELVARNAVFLLDLEPERIIKSASRTIRTKIYHAAKNGYALIDQKPVLAEALARLYPEAMRRLGAQPHYFFSEESLHRWVHNPASLVLGASLDDAIQAVCVFNIANGCAEAHIMGSTERGRSLLPWLIWQGATQLRQRGATILNLGGGGHPGDGLYRFKERFGGNPKSLRAVRQIYDKARYRDLCRQAGVSMLQAARFPAYRAGSMF